MEFTFFFHHGIANKSDLKPKCPNCQEMEEIAERCKRDTSYWKEQVRVIGGYFEAANNAAAEHRAENENYAAQIVALEGSVRSLRRQVADWQRALKASQDECKRVRGLVNAQAKEKKRPARKSAKRRKQV